MSEETINSTSWEYWAEVYKPDKHQEMLMSWFAQWNIDSSILDILPTTGLIIPNKAAMFVYLTNSKLCFLDCFICNKEMTREDRDMALDLVMSQLVRYLRDNGNVYMAAYSSNPKVIDRAVDHFGFNKNKDVYQCIVRSV